MSNADTSAALEDTKPWYASKAVIGSIISILALAAGAFGLKIDPATQSFIVDQVTGSAAAVVVLAGAAMGIYGRVTATKKIA